MWSSAVTGPTDRRDLGLPASLLKRKLTEEEIIQDPFLFPDE